MRIPCRILGLFRAYYDTDNDEVVSDFPDWQEPLLLFAMEVLRMAAFIIGTDLMFPFPIYFAEAERKIAAKYLHDLTDKDE